MGTAVFIQGTLCPAKKSMVVEEVERDLWETASNSTDEKNKAQAGEVTCPRSPSNEVARQDVTSLSTGAVVTVTQRKAEPQGSCGEEASRGKWYLSWVFSVGKRGKDLVKSRGLEERKSFLGVASYKVHPGHSRTISSNGELITCETARCIWAYF